jgi:hypothetical protein
MVAASRTATLKIIFKQTPRDQPIGLGPRRPAIAAIPGRPGSASKTPAQAFPHFTHPPSGVIAHDGISRGRSLAAVLTIGALSSLVVHIARVDVMEPAFQCDLPCSPKRRRECWRQILHAPIRVEGGKMKRHIRTQPFPDPFAQRLNLGCRVDCLIALAALNVRRFRRS